ncbi:MAG: HEAT repeat domain-containing protein, partial [Planctomycetota bacterium]
ALALMGAHEAADPLRAALAQSQYRPDELARTAEALRRLGDEGAPEILVELLAGSRGLATQAAISMALARTGDPRAVPALAALLEDGSKTRMARSFAACALGLLLDPRPLPWSAALARDVNPFVASPGLHEPTGSGALDRF